MSVRDDKQRREEAGQPQDFDDDIPIASANASASSAYGYGRVESSSDAPFGFAPLRADSAANVTSASARSTASAVFPSFTGMNDNLMRDTSEDVDTKYATDYLSIIDDDNVLAEVDMNIGHSKLVKTERSPSPTIAGTPRHGLNHAGSYQEYAESDAQEEGEQSEDEEYDDQDINMVDAAAKDLSLIHI